VARTSWLRRAIETLKKSPSTAVVKPPSNDITTITAWTANRPVPQEGVDLKSLIDEGYRRNVIVYCCVNEIAQSAASPRYFLRNRKTQEEVEEHELLDVFARPAPGLSWYELIERVLIYQQVGGTAYIHKGRAQGNAIVQLKPIRPERMQPVPDAQGNIVRYEYRIEGSDPQMVDPLDVATFHLPDPLNDFHGLSPLAVAAIFGDIDTAAAIYLRDFFANGAMPMGLLKFKMPGVRPEDRRRVQQEWEETYGAGERTVVDPKRPSRWHNVGVLGGDVEYQALASEPAQLRLDAVWGMTESRLCATFGVPPAIIQARIGLQFSTYSNQREARRSFWTETLVPIYRRLADGITRNVVAEVDEELEFAFDLDSIPELQEDLNSRADRASKLFLSGVASFNEARGLSDLEEGPVDFYAHPNTVTIIPREELESGKVFKDAADAKAAGMAALQRAGEPGQKPPPFGKKPAPGDEPPDEGQAGDLPEEGDRGLPFEVLGLGTMPEESEREIMAATALLLGGFSEAVREAVESSDTGALADSLARGDWRSAERAVGTGRLSKRYAEELANHLVRVAESAARMHYQHHAGPPRETHGDGHWVTIKGHPVLIGDGGGAGGGGASSGVFTTVGSGMSTAPGGVKMSPGGGQPKAETDLRPLSKSPLPITNFKSYDPKLSTPEQAAQLEATRKHVEAVYSDPLVAIPRASWDGMKAVELRPAAAAKPGLTGYYRSEKQELTIIVQPKHMSRNTPIHELGHHVHMAKVTAETSNEWAALSHDGKACKISNYGRTNAGEHFAEAFRNYADTRSPSKPGFLAPREWLKKVEPNTHAFMAKLWSTPSMWLPTGKYAPLSTAQARYHGKKI
jgi:HK97 family phage portal protein